MSRPLRVAHITTVDLSLRFLVLDQLRALRDAGFEVSAISAPGRWSADLASEGIRHLPWRSVTRAWDPRADARALAELVAVLRRERFDLVHTHTPKAGVLGRVAARLAGVPCVVNTVHGLFARPEDRARRRLPVLAIERLAARFSDLELYASGEDLAWARQIGVVSPSRSLLLGGGVDLREFDPSAVTPARRAELRRELGLPESAIVVTAVGRMVAEKGFRELFAAAAAVRAANPDARFLVVGDADRDRPDAIRDHELAAARPDVTFAGWREDVRDLLAASDVFVLASSREGMPRSAMEAAALGKALVLTDVRGCREVGRDRREALLVPPRDPDRLAGAITALAGDAALRARLGAAARERALRLFDERRVQQTLVDEYRRLAARKGIASPDRSLHLRRARRDDAPALACLHRDGMPDAFLPTLGVQFLSLLYRALADHHGAVTLVAEQDGEVVGFAAGLTSGREFSRRFYGRYGLLAVAAAARELRRPSAARRALETARQVADHGGLPGPEVISTAVAPGFQGRGLGRRLLEGVLAGLADLGASDVRVVVGARNDAGNGLYSSLGFEHAAEISVHDGVSSNVLVAPCR